MSSRIQARRDPNTPRPAEAAGPQAVRRDDESGLRSHIFMELQYRHVMEDLENGTIPVAVVWSLDSTWGRKLQATRFSEHGPYDCSQNFQIGVTIRFLMDILFLYVDNRLTVEDRWTGSPQESKG